MIIGIIAAFLHNKDKEGKTFMKYKAVIFDLDGTLLDTIDDLADSMNFVLNSKGYSQHEVHKYKYFVGDGMKNLVKRALPHDISESVHEECHRLMQERYAISWSNKSTAYSGVPELLDYLQDNNIKMCILSNKPHRFTVEMVNKLLNKWSFDVVFGEREGINRKPDPAGALEIADILKLSPSDILYLGDTNTDMITANNAKMNAVGVLWGFREKDELVEHGAKFILEKPQDLIKIIEA